MVYEPIIRSSAGLGRLSMESDPDQYDKGFTHCDVLIAGAGPTGLSAALAAGRSGARVLLADEDFLFGGRLNGEAFEIGGGASADWAASATAELHSMPNVRLMPRTQCSGHTTMESSAYWNAKRIICVSRAASQGRCFGGPIQNARLFARAQLNAR